MRHYQSLLRKPWCRAGSAVSPTMRMVAIGVALLALMAAGIVMPSTANSQESSEDSTFRIIVIPDTQDYSTSTRRASTAIAQLQWAVDQAQVSNTVFVTHVGDVVDEATSRTEWDRLEPGFQILDEAGLAYAIAPGNHDLVYGGGPVPYDERFDTTRFSAAPWFGGSHEAEGNRSSWQTLSVEGHDLLFIHIRHLLDTYGDVSAVLAWVDEVLALHPDHLAIVTTHEFTSGDGSIAMGSLAAVLDDHCNVAVVLSGHRSIAARGEFTDACGRSVMHLLTNYSYLSSGGDGYLRILDIDTTTLQVDSQVYSPTKDTSRTDDGEKFTATLSKLEPVPGDANCDRQSDVVDALMIAQFVTGTRSDRGSCPLAPGSQEISTSGSDLDDDGSVTVVDALITAQCSVGITNAWCS